MSWIDTLVPMVRSLIGDMDTPYTFTDCRVEQVIAISAQFVKTELEFDTDYTIDVDAITITPDPIAAGDDLFMNLTSMKAACILTRSQLKTAASKEGILVKDGMGSLEVKGGFKAYSDMAQSFCEAYQKAKLEYAMGNFASVKAIFNVASGPNINNYDSHRGFYR